MRGTGPIVLLQPGGAGWGGDANLYIETFKPVEEIRTIVYLEPRGIGRSERLHKDGVYSIDEYAEDIEALREYLNIPRIGIIGHSHGGFVALKYAIKYPDNINSLILMGTSPTIEHAKPVGLKWAMKIIGIRKIVVYILKSFLRSDEKKLRAQLKMILPSIHFYDFERIANKFNALLDDMIISPKPVNYYRKYETFNVVDQLSNITVPVLIIRGEIESPSVIEGTTVLKESIKEAKQIIIDKSGHWPMIEAPEILFREMKTYYQESGRL